MVSFITHIEDKKNYIGWVHVIVPASIAMQLHPDDKKSFRVKGTIDDYAIKSISLLPAGEGDYYLAINASIRKKIGKHPSDKVTVRLEKDEAIYTLPQLLLDCLEDDPSAKAFFNGLPNGHQRYFGNWIDGAKTAETKEKRVAESINALARKQHFGMMMQQKKKERGEG